MKIFYDEKGKDGKYFELQGVEDFPKMKKINGIFSNVTTQDKLNFNYSLENVIDGSYTFYWNWNLVSFNSNLSKLENGVEMFHNCVKFKSFATDLPSLTNGYWMFYGCNLTSFNADMPSLVNGERMFYTCSQLNSFSSNLGSLKSGYEMFYDCKLNEESLYNIAETINDITDLDKEIDEHWTYEVLGETETIDDMYRGLMTVGVDSSVTETQKNNFVSEMNKKGWTVNFSD